MTTHENNNQSLISFDGLRSTRAGNVLSLIMATTALAAGASVLKATIDPGQADANTPGLSCTKEVKGNTTIETCVSGDGKVRSVTETTSSDGQTPQETEPTPIPTLNPKPQPKKDPAVERQKRKERRQAKRERKTNSQKHFRGYDMGNSSFTDGNGCFITAAASAFRRETGNRHIRPTSGKLYHPELKSRWDPYNGVKEPAYLFDALPAMAARYNLKVSGGESGLYFDAEEAQAMRRALRRNDEVMIVASAGHFTAGGHYMAVRGLTRGGRFIIDDPNGTGRHGDSERSIGWSGAELGAAGVFDYRILSLRGAK
jgi:hypothetical protein